MAFHLMELATIIKAKPLIRPIHPNINHSSSISSKSLKDYGIRKASRRKVFHYFKLGLVYLRKAVSTLDFIIVN